MGFSAGPWPFPMTEKSLILEVKGHREISSDEGEETLRAGDVFYLSAGHTGVAEEDTEFPEVSPPDQHQAFTDVAHRTLEAQAPA